MSVASKTRALGAKSGPGFPLDRDARIKKRLLDPQVRPGKRARDYAGWSPLSGLAGPI
jgi:hypothetical protein